MKNEVKHWRDACFEGVDLLKGDFANHSYESHAHSEFAILVFERGAGSYDAAGKTRLASPGCVSMMAPFTEHNGRGLGSEGWSHRAFYPTSGVVRTILGDQKARALPALFESTNPIVFDAVLAAHRLFESNPDVLAKEEALIRMLEILSAASSSPSSTLLAKASDAGVKLEQAREYIEENYAANLTMSLLARVVGFSAPHLMRTFRARYGMCVHAYVTSVRLRHARRLLLAGHDHASVAVQVGFADQSHLIRRFKRTFGSTPGRYVRDSQAPVRLLASCASR